MPRTTETDKKEVFAALHRLILNGDLLIWDPRTKSLHGSEAIAGVSMNGDAIQISLTERDRCPECESETVG